jgi:hypothetical protein
VGVLTGGYDLATRDFLRETFTAVLERHRSSWLT